ncbi:hypothetical protein [Porphyromonas gingivalis]|uniref:hypothetical protein n=1 Tax=Porphyromonas gingivalis TaxID=837 RepID=UPI0003AD1BE4|nr:hypothetical protein [Porphyromonas gingivalis]ERJ69120.1 hypothetical protein HMPREF1553_00724 [Porphyromonas gingivalis F0568]MCE8164761.1 hypothetical protein [Porphyromonas gingivalis]MCE8179850.1 hypothetical protein [Porphyromonas gingivalis]MCE8187238.1 hypothetical protein [Porphyromonas gingivalis]
MITWEELSEKVENRKKALPKKKDRTPKQKRQLKKLNQALHVVQKMKVFEYIVAQSIGMGRGEAKTREEYDALLRNYNITHWMKTLYFICLSDYDRKFSSRGCKFPDDGVFAIKQGNLLKLFDGWTAYEKGPVEADIYDNRFFINELSPLFSYDGYFLQLKDSVDEQKAYEIVREEKCKSCEEDGLENSIDESIKHLFSGLYTPLYYQLKEGLSGGKQAKDSLVQYTTLNTQMVIEASHSFVAWKECWNKNSNRENKIYSFKDIQAYLLDAKQLRKEVEYFRGFRVSTEAH